MNSAQIIHEQIKNQITGHKTLLAFYTDCNSENIGLINKEKKFIKPILLNEREITEQQFCEILGMIEDKRFYNTDTLHLNTKMTYDEFWNKFYNREGDLTAEQYDKKIDDEKWKKHAQWLLAN